MFSEHSGAGRGSQEAARACLPAACTTKPGSILPPERYVPETRRARDELGLIETVSLEKAIQRTASWDRQDIVRY